MLIERRQDLRLTLESPQSFHVLGELLGKDFDRYVPPELSVAGAIDFAHPADSQESYDLERAQGGSLRNPRAVPCGIPSFIRHAGQRPPNEVPSGRPAPQAEQTETDIYVLPRGGTMRVQQNGASDN